MNHIEPSYHESAVQRTPCMLVLDVSGSMLQKKRPDARATGIAELNQGLTVLRDALRDDVTAMYRVQLAIVTVGGTNGAKFLLPWTDAVDFDPPTLTAGGVTPLAGGMRLALHHVEQHKQSLRQLGIPYTRPWVMVISDGEPTDAPALWESIALDCKDAERRKRCVIYPIGVEGADLSRLQELSLTPAKALSAARFAEYFRWLSNSLSLVSTAIESDSVSLDASDLWESHSGTNRP